jgi:hypothetical protein
VKIKGDGTEAGFPLGKWQPSPAICPVHLRACHPRRVNLKAGSKYNLQLAAHRIMPCPSSIYPTFSMQLLCVGLLMAWVVASQYINCKPVLVIHFFHSVLSIFWLWGYRLCGLQLVFGSWKRSQRFRPRPSTQKALVSSSERPEHIVCQYHAPVILYGRLSMFILVPPLCVPAVGYLLPFVPLKFFTSLGLSSWLLCLWTRGAIALCAVSAPVSLFISFQNAARTASP